MNLDHTLSFQLYTSRDFPPLDQQLLTLAELGVTNVEPYGTLYEDVEGLAAALTAAGLSSESGHFDPDMLESDFPRAIGVAEALGMKLVVAPWIAPELRPSDAAGWRALGERLEALAVKLADRGLSFAWHNHDFEFVALCDGSHPIEHLMSGDGLQLELDVAWVIKAGADPSVWLRRYAERIAAIHMKDIAPAGEKLDEGGWIAVGEGTIDWPAIWAEAGKTTARLAILEHDEPKDWVAFTKTSIATLRALQG